MPRLLIELTNRCNLRCRHCFPERHAATADLPLTVLQRILSEARANGIEHLCFNGGEPTIHRQFRDIIKRVSDAGYAYSIVSNGMNFRRICGLLLRYRARLTNLTFSLDGASEATHDSLRGRGSFRRVIQAASLCLFKDIPFTFNMVLTRENRHEVGDMVLLAEKLGSTGVRFGHLVPELSAQDQGLQLRMDEKLELEKEIWALQEQGKIPVAMAPGHYSESPFFTCAPLALEEFNVDYRGNMTLCCHLSGSAGPNARAEIIANLADTSLSRALDGFRRRVEQYVCDKRKTVSEGSFREEDHFPCHYCVKHHQSARPRTAPDIHWRPVVVNGIN